MNRVHGSTSIGLKQLAEKYGLLLLPEIHSQYDEKIHEKLAA